MDELMISGKRHISSRRAAKEYHYHSDYIGQLIRGGKLSAQKVGRTWYVSIASLDAYFRKEKEAVKETYQRTPKESEQKPLSPPEKEFESIRPAEQPKAQPAPDPMPVEKVFSPDAKLLRYLNDEEANENTNQAPRMEMQEAAQEKKKIFRGQPEALSEKENTRERWSGSQMPLNTADTTQAGLKSKTEEDEEEEVPVALRITARPAVSPYTAQRASARFYQPAKDNIYNTDINFTQEFPRELRRGRKLAIVIIIIIFAALAFASTYFVSTYLSSQISIQNLDQ